MNYSLLGRVMQLDLALGGSINCELWKFGPVIQIIESTQDWAISQYCFVEASALSVILTCFCRD